MDFPICLGTAGIPGITHPFEGRGNYSLTGGLTLGNSYVGLGRVDTLNLTWCTQADGGELQAGRFSGGWTATTVVV